MHFSQPLNYKTIYSNANYLYGYGKYALLKFIVYCFYAHMV